MLEDMILDLLEATNDKEREKAYRRLEKVGMDRRTADIVAGEYVKEMK